MAEIKNDSIVNARVCFGGMAAIPKRAIACEQALTGARRDSDAVEKAATAILIDFEPITDMRASAGYRKQLAVNLLRRFFADTSDLSVERGDKDAISVWHYAEQRA